MACPSGLQNCTDERWLKHCLVQGQALHGVLNTELAPSYTTALTRPLLRKSLSLSLTWQDLLDLACPSGLQNCTDESWLKLKNATKVTIEELAYLAEVSRQITTMYPNFALIMNCTYVAVIIKVGRGKGEGGRGIEGRGGALREG